MNLEEMITKSIEHGNSIGQLALAEFILKNYANDISPTLRLFLQKVSAGGCENVAETLEKPSEDIALSVSQIMDRRT